MLGGVIGGTGVAPHAPSPRARERRSGYYTQGSYCTDYYTYYYTTILLQSHHLHELGEGDLATILKLATVLTTILTTILLYYYSRTIPTSSAKAIWPVASSSMCLNRRYHVAPGVKISTWGVGRVRREDFNLGCELSGG